MAEVEYTIEIQALAPRVATNISVKNNLLESCGNGIRLSRNIKGHIAGNDFNACTSIAIHIQAGARCIVEGNTGENPGSYFLSYSTGGNEPTGTVFRNNFCVGAANIAIRNHAFNSNKIWADGNQWTDTPLIYPVTLSAVATTTIPHGGIAAHARIDLAPSSDSFGALIAAPGLRASPNGADFDVRMVNGGAAAGGETGTAFIHQ